MKRMSFRADDGYGPSGKGLGDKLMTIGLVTPDRDEETVRADMTRIKGDEMNLGLRVERPGPRDPGVLSAEPFAQFVNGHPTMLFEFHNAFHPIDDSNSVGVQARRYRVVSIGASRAGETGPQCEGPPRQRPH